MGKYGQPGRDIDKLMCQIATLRAISDVVTTGLYAVDHRTDEIVYFNDAFLEMWGVGHIKGQMRRGELKNSDMVSIMLQLSHDPGTLSKYYEQFREANNISHVSDVIWLRDGRIFHFNSSRVVDEDGLYHSRVYAFDDITSVIEAERSAHERGDQFRELVDMLPQVIFEIDTEGKLTFANRNAFAVMGYTEDELAEGLCVSDVIALEDYPEASKQILNVLSGGRSGHEYTFVRKDRSRFKAIVHSSIIYRDGRPSGLRGIAVDLTERKQEEEKLLLMQASIDSFHDPCIWAEENGRIIYLNDAACHTLGYSMDELLHMRISDFDVSYDNDRFMEKGQEIRASGGAHFETLHRTKDGRVFPVEISAKYIRYGDKRYVLSFEHDITDRKRAEDQLKNSLVEKEVLLKEVHHRVKNNMQIISSLLNLQLSGIDQEPVRQILTESQNRIRSIALVHERMYRSGDLSRIDFMEYVRNLGSQLLHTYMMNSGQVTLIVDGDRIELGVDQAVPCGLIVNELISNSLKYAFPGSRHGAITIHLLRKGTASMIIAEDDGIGIPEEISLSSAQSMGMQLVTALIDQLDGTIDLDRSGGTRFTITFPVR